MPIHGLGAVVRLPLEVLYQIFRDLCAFVDEASHASGIKTRTQTRLNISHICAHWRAATHSCPDLWTYLAIDDACVATRERALANLSRLQTWMGRAKTRPLDVIIHLNIIPPALPDRDEDLQKKHSLARLRGRARDKAIYTSKPAQDFLHLVGWLTSAVIHPWLQSVAQVFPQWRTFEWCSNHFDHQSLLVPMLDDLRFPPDASLLQTISLRHYAMHKPALPGIGIRIHAPRLQRVDLQCIQVDWSSTKLFRGLTHLNLDASGFDTRDGERDNAPSPTQVIDILAACPELVSLTLAHIAPEGCTAHDFPPRTDAVTLENLTKLTLKFVCGAYVYRLLLLVQLPALCDLAIEDLQFIPGALVRAHKLGTLRLGGLTRLVLDAAKEPMPPSADLARLAARLSNLEDLKLLEWDEDLSFLGPAPAPNKKVEAGGSTPCPRLVNLTINPSPYWDPDWLKPFMEHYPQVEVVYEVPAAKKASWGARVEDQLLSSNVSMMVVQKDYDGFPTSAQRNAWHSVLQHARCLRLGIRSAQPDPEHESADSEKDYEPPTRGMQRAMEAYMARRESHPGEFAEEDYVPITSAMRRAAEAALAQRNVCAEEFESTELSEEDV